LIAYDGKPAPEWGSQLNLNALLALLSTVLRGLLVVVISQIISQRKWDWYSKNRIRSLVDLQTFDSGSRGIFGALMLIPKVVLKDTITLVAAAILIVSFLIGPFVQQASRTTPCLVPAPDSSASLPYANYVPRHGGVSFESTRSGTYYAPVNTEYSFPSTAAAILSSITAPNGTENQMRGNCSTGTCTFSNADQAANTAPDLTDGNPSLHSTAGMCDKCIDVTPLVSRSYNSTLDKIKFTLPNGMNQNYTGAGGRFATIEPSANLEWMGELLTPDLRKMSRWAYVNTTFLTLSGNFSHATEDIGVLATVCVLYPCIRTYTASITNNQLLEKEVSSQMMELSSELKERVVSSQEVSVAEDSLESNVIFYLNAQDQSAMHYAAVRSPCQVGGQIYDTSLNTTIASHATSLRLYDFPGPGPRNVTYRNITAPEPCIYRQHTVFVEQISVTLNKEIFNGSCDDDFKSTYCYRDYYDDDDSISTVGVKTMLESLIEGNRSFSNVTSWFHGFANAMTNRFRFEFGAAAFNRSLQDEELQNLTLGEVQGIAWQTNTCVSAHKAWLALPISLTGITALLMLFTIISNWQHRRTRPVWKDNILPMLFYRQIIKPEEPGALPWQGGDATEREVEVRLMETSEMEKISKASSVTFQWLTSDKSMESIDKADTSAVSLDSAGEVPTQRTPHGVETESLIPNTLAPRTQPSEDHDMR
jgi:hypothetical protein